MPSMSPNLALLLSELDAILKVTSGLVSGRHWAKFRLKVGKFKHSTKVAVIGPALDRCKQWHWPNNNGRLLAADIGPILCRIITFGNSHLGEARLVLRSSNVQGFASKVLTLYEEEENFAPLPRYRRMRSSIFTFHSSVAQYTTLRYC